jgi:cytidylate kinase
MTKATPVIAIDGPSGSGKGTIARRVAVALGWHLLDSGALYRLLALAATRRGIGLDDADALAELAANLDVSFAANDDGEELIWLDGKPRSVVSCARRRRAAVPRPWRHYSRSERRCWPCNEAFGSPRDWLPTGAIWGLTCSPTPASRSTLPRHKQLKDKGIDVSLAALSRDIEDRDRRDSERSVAPLRPAEDARILDSSGQSIEAVTNRVLGWARELLAEKL